MTDQEQIDALKAGIQALKARASALERRLGVETLFCSFCNKSQHDVKKLIAGVRVWICDECVDVSHDLVHDTGKKT